MSVKGIIFRQLAAYLMETLQFDQVITEANPMPLPNLAWVDKQMGQFIHPELFNSIPLPGVLISFRKTQWENIGRQVQKGNAIITFWVYFENYADSFEGSMNQDKAIQFFDFNEAVHVALQGLFGESFTDLVRLSDEDDEDHDMIIGTIFEYGTTINDTSSDGQRKSVMVSDKIPVGKIVSSIERPDNAESSTDNGFNIDEVEPEQLPLYKPASKIINPHTYLFEDEFEKNFE